MSLRFAFARGMSIATKIAEAVTGTRVGFRILIFHDVTPDVRPAFEDLVAHLAGRGALLTPDAAARWIAGDGPKAAAPSPPCLLTFDDGFAGNYELAASVLAKHGAKAVFFVCPGLVDLGADAQLAAVRANVFSRAVTDAAALARLRLMNWTEIGDLVAAGHAIGAHGMTHRALSSLSGEDLRREILESGARIEAEISRPVEWYAYAFGGIEHISAAALEIIAGRYPLCRSGIRGLNRAGANRLALLADHVDLLAPPAYQRLTAEGALDIAYLGRRRRYLAMCPK